MPQLFGIGFVLVGVRRSLSEQNKFYGGNENRTCNIVPTNLGWHNAIANIKNHMCNLDIEQVSYLLKQAECIKITAHNSLHSGARA